MRAAVEPEEMWECKARNNPCNQHNKKYGGKKKDKDEWYPSASEEANCCKKQIPDVR